MNLEELMAGEDSELAGTYSKLAGTIFTIGKWNSNENSGVEKVQNQNNPGFLRNSDWISQPKSCWLVKRIIYYLFLVIWEKIRLYLWLPISFPVPNGWVISARNQEDWHKTCQWNHNKYPQPWPKINWHIFTKGKAAFNKLRIVINNQQHSVKTLSEGDLETMVVPVTPTCSCNQGQWRLQMHSL
jgi:hypothetical protein